MATGANGKNYGVGDAADKMNVGPNTGVKAVLDNEGKVRVDGEVVFDPKEDLVELNMPDPEIDYASAVGLPEESDK